MLLFFSFYYCFIGCICFLWQSHFSSLTDCIDYPFFTLFSADDYPFSFKFISSYLQLPYVLSYFCPPPPLLLPPLFLLSFWGGSLYFKFSYIYSCNFLCPLFFNCIRSFRGVIFINLLLSDPCLRQLLGLVNKELYFYYFVYFLLLLWWYWLHH